MKRIAIVGGGIAGLSAAFELEQRRRQGDALEYALYERAPRLGGVIRTERTDNGCLIEAGPDAFLTEKPWAAELCCELGLSDQLLGSNDAQRRTCIVVRGRLVPIPEGLQFMVPTRIAPVLSTPLFSFRTKLRMAREWFLSPRGPAGDESAADFVARHFGREVVERLADPLLAGVYGGTAESLSARAVLPRFVAMEEKHGSLARAMSVRRTRTAPPNPAPPLFTTLRNGMQQMVEALAVRLDPAALRLGVEVRRVVHQAGRWRVAGDSSGEDFDAVILAVPAYVAAALLRDSHTRLPGLLEQIPYSSSVTVALGYDSAVPLPAGFGFLVPRTEGLRLLACTFVHNKFPHRAPEGWRLLRVFLGGRSDERAGELTDAEIAAIVRDELRQLLCLETEPRFVRIYRWPRAMAQYEVGHLERLAEITRLRKGLPGLFLAGNAYGGIGVPDCVREGRQAARDALVIPSERDGTQ
ncbi:MAG TPA: protoporphyrinogen oxidase [Terriglobales bacterium]|nr:protoporphyrinogen oxidase [Terriglobales bacterium]